MTQDDLYIMQMAVTGDIKVGRSQDPERRLKQLQTGAPHRLKILLVAPGLGYQERHVHQVLHHCRNRGKRGEWFSEDALGSVPDHLFEMFPVEILEDPDWWKVL
tara:strand:- start:2268 stop:2579 length:312 start_codon:yes stop_codon:yes gene_type:complete